MAPAVGVCGHHSAQEVRRFHVKRRPRSRAGKRELYLQLLSLALLWDPVFRCCSRIRLCLDKLNGMFQGKFPGGPDLLERSESGVVLYKVTVINDVLTLWRQLTAAKEERNPC